MDTVSDIDKVASILKELYFTMKRMKTMKKTKKSHLLPFVWISWIISGAKKATLNIREWLLC